jgi:uncharacterized protein (DUF4415 family)
MKTIHKSNMTEREYKLTQKEIRQMEADAIEPNLTDPDAPEITDEQMCLAKRRGRPIKADRKKIVSIRLPSVTVDKLRLSGKGWQTRLSSEIEKLIKKGVL